MKNALIIFILLFSFFKGISQTKTHYELADLNVLLKYDIIAIKSDSSEISAELINRSEHNIWITVDSFIFNPKIQGGSFYLNMGEDLIMHSPMDIVPFPLRALKKGDSVKFKIISYSDNFNSISMICNYLMDEDYKKILKAKKISSAIGSLDYYKFMKLIFMNADLKCKQ